MSTEFHTLPVRSVRRETADAVSIVLDVPASLRETFLFEPGQYLTVKTVLGGEDVRRSYSVCSGLDDGELRIAVRRHDGGLFSTFANTKLKAGDRLDVMVPRGGFTLPPATGAARSVFAVAAGSGITPILSLLKTVLAREPQSQAVLIYGNRNADGIIFKREIEDLKDRHIGRLSVFHVLSREDQDLAVLNGRIDADKLGAALRSIPGGKPDVAFLCGPLPLLKLARETLEAAGLAREQIRTEIFTAQTGPRPAGAATPPPALPPAPASEADVVATARLTLNGRVRSITIRVNETVLEAALRQGLDAPFSCRGGMCCTCRAKLVEGQVVMAANYSLEPWEEKAGFVLTCQSRPTTPAIAVDYDAH
jgi:ring-1,2-phenylacetyl-CoA epoxidase subunit PaaE